MKQIKPRKEKFESGDRVKTPDGNGEIFEASKFLPYVSVFLDGERKARIFGRDEIERIQNQGK